MSARPLSDPELPVPRAPSARGGSAARTESLHLAVLASLAFAAPLFDLLGRNAQFFTVRRSAPADLAAFVLALSLGVPAVLVGAVSLASLLGERARRAAHGLALAALVALIALPALRRVHALPGRVAAALALAAGIAAALGYRRVAPIRSFLTVLSPAALVIPALFVARPGVRSQLFPIRAQGLAAVEVKKPAPVFLVILDELPIASLMDAGGGIDAVRYPAFGALARNATWFRNATSVAENTTYAVPAILTGRRPPSSARLPNVAGYPENLFTLLGARYRITALEPLTSLCPDAVNERMRVKEPFVKRLRSLASDSAVVWAHLELPPSLTRSLPPVAAAWSDFAARANTGGAGGAVREEARAVLAEFLDSIQAPAGAPEMHVLHADVPHVPWQYLPSGRQYGPLENWWFPHGVTDETWSTDAWEVAQGWQRHLLQVGFADHFLGSLIERLKALDLYDESVIVVVADHGVSFRPGGRRRGLTPENVADLASVPLFVKAPLQKTGVVSDRGVETIDVVPTIASLLGVTIPWRVDGVSALDGAPHTEKTICSDECAVKMSVPDDPGRLAETLRRQQALFGSGTTFDAVIAAGPAADLLGRRAGELLGAPRPETTVELAADALYQKVDPTSGFLPTNVRGTIAAPHPERLALAVTVDGIVRATTETFSDGGSVKFSAMLPESALRAGANDIGVYAIAGAARQRRLSELQERRVETYASAAGSAVLTRSGSALAPGNGKVAGFLEAVEISHRLLSVRGWAADLAHKEPVERVVVLVDGASVYESRPRLARPDLVAAYHSAGIAASGFELRLPFLADGPEDLARVRAFGVSRTGEAVELKRLAAAAGPTVTDGTGARIPVVDGAVQGFVEGAIVEGSVAHLVGWSADVDDAPAAKVLVVARGRSWDLFPSIERPDVARAFKRDTLLRSGFAIDVDLGKAAEEELGFVRVYGITRGGQATELPRSRGFFVRTKGGSQPKSGSFDRAAAGLQNESPRMQTKKGSKR